MQDHQQDHHKTKTLNLEEIKTRDLLNHEENSGFFIQ
jgi:hypothetical protein